MPRKKRTKKNPNSNQNNQNNKNPNSNQNQPKSSNSSVNKGQQSKNEKSTNVKEEQSNIKNEQPISKNETTPPNISVSSTSEVNDDITPPPNLQEPPIIKEDVNQTKGGDLATISDKLKQELAPKPQRYPYGQLRKCTVNHFLISIGAENVYQYRVNFDPEIDNPRARRCIVDTLCPILGNQFVFDNGSLLFAARKYNDQHFNDCKFNNHSYNVEIRLVKTITVSNMSPQVYSVFCRRILHFLELTPLGRHYFDTSQSIRIRQHHIELWPGFFTSIVNTMRGATLCADITHKILRTDTVLNMLHNSKNNRNYKSINSKLLDGQIVLTRYNNRTYRVDGIEWNLTPLSKFTAKSGEMTYIQFYKNIHNLTITDLKQPLLRIYNRRTKATIYLVPEFCCLTGLSDQMRADYKVMQDLDKHTKTNPSERYDRLVEFSKSINASKNVQQGFSEWKVHLDETPIKVEGRLLPEEKLSVGKQEISAGPKAQWNNKSIVKPVPINNSIFIYPNQVSKEAKELLNQIEEFSKQFRIRFNAPKVIRIQSDSPDNYTNAISQNITNSTDMIICLLQRKGHSYDSIKVLCCKELGIPSQCVLAKSMKNPKRIRSIASKIVQQIDCKAGGELWHVKIPLQKTMIIGVDVCHDTYSDKGRGKRSVVGFCASTNNNYTKYFSTVKFQGVGQEIVDQLSECFEEALDNWKRINNSYPDKVIVYRDGVGEGQFLEVLNHEVPQITDVLKKKNSTARLTVVIVQKRIHTRVFDHTTNLKNPSNAPPGTVIDNVCVSKDTYDFYMVSQHVLMGTATPTHYRIIKDEVGLRQDIMQTLTYKLCHLYYNWSGTIRVPAPCHYAHKIAFLIGQSVHSKPHENLDNLLHFL